jgi:hypothetical protein
VLTENGSKAIEAPLGSHDGQTFHMSPGSVGQPHRVHSPAGIFSGKEMPDRREALTGAGRTPWLTTSIERAQAAAIWEIVVLINERAKHARVTRCVLKKKLKTRSGK